MTIPVGKRRLRLAAVPMALAAAAFAVGAAGFFATLEMPDYSKPLPGLAEVVWPGAGPTGVTALPPAVVFAAPESATLEEAPAETSAEVFAARATVSRPTTAVAPAPASAPAPQAIPEPSPSTSPSPSPSARPTQPASAVAIPEPGEVGAAGTPAVPAPPPGTPTPPADPGTITPPSPTPTPAPADEGTSGPGKRLGVAVDNPGNGPKNDKNNSKPDKADTVSTVEAQGHGKSK